MASSNAGPGIDEEGRLLVERLGGRWTATGGICRCPAHDDHAPSLSVRPGRRRLLLHCFAGCDASAILRALETGHLLEPSTAGADRGLSWRDECPQHSAAARRLWDEARSIAGTPAASYLASRGVVTASAQLRYHPSTPHGPRPLTRYRPALIAAVRDGSGLIAIHRTFLDPGRSRSAFVRGPRCGLGRFGQGAVRLGGGGSRLGLAEGIETALSATLLFGVPCWATLGTERFGRVAMPAEVDELVLFLDHDCGGRRAERIARDAFTQVSRIHVEVPQRRGEDWNDVLVAKGAPAPATMINPATLPTAIPADLRSTGSD